VPLLALPFDAVARLLGFLAFPDRLRFLLFVGGAAFILARGLDAARRAGAPASTHAWGAMGGAAFVTLGPAFVRLCNTRFVVYAETIAYGCLWGVLLLGLLLGFAARQRPRILVSLALCAGFAVVIRPTALAYGAGALGLALVVGFRAGVSRKTLAVGALPFLVGPAFFLLTNALRFGSPFRVGVSNIIGAPSVNFVTRFESPFSRVGWWSSACELFGFLFLLPAAPLGIGDDDRPWWLAPAWRYREFWFQPFDLVTLASVVLSLGLAAFCLLRPGTQVRTARFSTPGVLLVLWGVGCTAALFVFYARLPYVTPRYLVEFGPPFGAIVLGGCWLLAHRLEGRPQLVRGLGLLGCAVAFAWTLTRNYDRAPNAASLRVSDAATLRARDHATLSHTPFVPPTRYACPETDVTPGSRRPRWSPLGWTRECRIDWSIVLALSESRCVEVDIAPARGPWSPEALAAVEALSVRQDFEELLRCALDDDPLHKRIVFCRKGEPATSAREGTRLVALGLVLPDGDPAQASRHIAVKSVRAASRDRCHDR
jgi:hypothetical protein